MSSLKTNVEKLDKTTLVVAHKVFNHDSILACIQMEELKLHRVLSAESLGDISPYIYRMSHESGPVQNPTKIESKKVLY